MYSIISSLSRLNMSLSSMDVAQHTPNRASNRYSWLENSTCLYFGLFTKCIHFIRSGTTSIIPYPTLSQHPTLPYPTLPPTLPYLNRPVNLPSMYLSHVRYSLMSVSVFSCVIFGLFGSVSLRSRLFWSVSINYDTALT